MGNGLIFGKFAPFHNGHVHLIREALKRTTRLWVLVNDHPELTSHSTATRCGWIGDTFADAPLEVVPTSAPPPSGHSAEAKRQNFEHFRKHLPTGVSIEHVFCNEWYGEHIAHDFGATWETVDPDRSIQPISATQLREAPWAHWSFLPVAVRPAYVQLVCLVGAESTGKTTLAESLATHFGGSWVAEYAREYLAAHHNQCTPASMPHIAREQRRREEDARLTADRFLFCDTDALTTSIWSEHYFGSVDTVVEDFAKERRYALHLLLAADLPWEDDGMRDSPGRGTYFFKRFEAELTERSLPYRLVEGVGDARIKQAQHHVRGRFPGLE